MYTAGLTPQRHLDVAFGNEHAQALGVAAKIIGVSSSIASPSIPAYAVPEWDRISNSSQLNSKAWPLRAPWPARAKVTTSAACAPVAAVTANTPRRPCRAAGAGTYSATRRGRRGCSTP